MDDFAPRLSFFFNAHIDFFEEIAKYRAARRPCQAPVLKDSFDAEDRDFFAPRRAARTRSALVIVEMEKDATLMVSVPAASGQLPLTVLLRALGMPFRA